MVKAKHTSARDRPLSNRAFYWLAAGLTLPMVPHLIHIPWWIVILFTTSLAWCWWVTSQNRSLPRRGWLLVITLLVVGIVYHHYQTVFGQDAGVAMLSAMVSLKFLELRRPRDGMVLVFLGYVLAMANLLYTQSMLLTAYLLFALVILLAAQVMIHREHAGVPPLALVRLTTRMLVQSVPVMLILFVLFPRIPGPLWALPKDAHSGLTGLSDEMTPGVISRLSRSDEVAFRARFTEPEPSYSQLYWRGPVLLDYDGKTWRVIQEPVREVLRYEEGTETVEYAVILEPHGKRWLFALDLPASIPTNAGATTSFQLRRSSPVNELLRYEVRSYLHYKTGSLSFWERRWSLRLPPEGNSQARQLAGEWRQQYSNPEDRVHAALALFQEEPFYYTLTPPLLGEDGVDGFLFNTRRGFCEHYAGSFVFLMRAAGVPARVVTGYQGGERNAFGDYFIVRQSDAHAWAEVWLEGRGWVRVDPTAAVAPERVEQGLYAAVVDPLVLPFMVRRDNLWLHQVALGWDYLNNAWNEWVLAYGPDRQRQFLSGLGYGPVGSEEMIVALVVSLSIFGMVFLGLHEFRRPRTQDPVTRIYHRFCAKLARRGLVRKIHEGPLDFAERAAAQRPELASRVRLIATLYTNVRYGRLNDQGSIRRLRRLVNKFKA